MNVFVFFALSRDVQKKKKFRAKKGARRNKRGNKEENYELILYVIGVNQMLKQSGIESHANREFFFAQVF